MDEVSRARDKAIAMAIVYRLCESDQLEKTT